MVFGFCGGRCDLPGPVLPDAVWAVVFHGRFFDNFIQKKEKRGRQGPAELRKEFEQILWRTRFERRCYMRPFAFGIAEQLAVLSGIGCKVYICSRRFKRIGVLALIRSVTNIANIKFST